MRVIILCKSKHIENKRFIVVSVKLCLGFTKYARFQPLCQSYDNQLLLNDEEVFDDPTLHRSSIRVHQCLIMTWPNLFFIVNRLSQFMKLNFKGRQYEKTIPQEILFKPEYLLKLEAFSGTYYMHLENSLIQLSFRKRKKVSLSSTKEGFKSNSHKDSMVKKSV